MVMADISKGMCGTYYSKRPAYVASLKKIQEEEI